MGASPSLFPQAQSQSFLLLFSKKEILPSVPYFFNGLAADGDEAGCRKVDVGGAGFLLAFGFFSSRLPRF